MRKTINTLLILFLLFSKSLAFADDIAIPGSGDPGVINDSPINDYIIPMLLVVLIFSYRILIVKKGSNTKEIHKSAMNW